MTGKDCSCAFERVYEVEMRGLHEDLRELKERVLGLETVLARGVLLLVANLAGVAVTLAMGLV